MTITPYYEDEHATVYLGKFETVLPQLDRVDVVLCDPPYSKHVHGAARSRKMFADDRGVGGGADLRRAVDLGFDAITAEQMDFLAAEAARLAARWSLFFSDVESAPDWRAALEGYGLDYVRTGAWVKTGSTPQFSGDRPAVGFEAITIAHPSGKKRWNGGGSHAVWTTPIVQNRDKKSPRWHTTEKPLPLMTALVDLFSEPGETILDPTAGSGTTGVAAKRLGRRSILIEEQEKHCKSIVKRLGQGALDFSSIEVTA